MALENDMNHRLNLLVISFFMLTGLMALSCASSGDAGDLAADLAERLTDKLEVDGGAVVDAPAPDTGSGGEIPTITALNAPATIAMEQTFQVELTTDYSNPAGINRVVVFIEGSIRHIHAAGIRFTGNTALLSMVVHEDAMLTGHDFVLHLALQSDDAIVGGYASWTMSIAKAGADAAEATN